MSRRATRGSAGTLRRLAPRPASRRRVPRANCLVRSGAQYLTRIDELRQPVLTPDITQALPLPADTARQVCLGMIELGMDAEVVSAGRMGR